MDQPVRVRPLSLAAARMDVSVGASRKFTPSPARFRCGSRPIRRLKKMSGTPKLFEARMPPKRNTSAPSTKKGRFSGKKVSNTLRLTTAGSTSTWPKSGFTVALIVRSLVRPYLRSSPAEP